MPLFQCGPFNIVATLLRRLYRIKTHSSESRGQVKQVHAAKQNDMTTAREDFTGTNVIQIRPACNPPSTNAITLKL